MRRWVGRGVVREAKDDVTREIYYALIEDQKTYAAEVSEVTSLDIQLTIDCTLQAHAGLVYMLRC
jgi:hypothetical protein